jgi:two-component system, probable response regulator PhcQ
MAQATILFVDDEESVRNALRRSLRKGDYRLFFADGPKQAFDLLREQAIDIIVSDHLMPGMTGLEFLKLARDRSPDAVRIMLTGQADMDTVVSAVNHGEIYRFLTKPWDDVELQVTLHLAYEKRVLERENRRLLAALSAHEELLARLERENPGLSGLLRAVPEVVSVAGR